MCRHCDSIYHDSEDCSVRIQERLDFQQIEKLKAEVRELRAENERLKVNDRVS